MKYTILSVVLMGTGALSTMIPYKEVAAPAGVVVHKTVLAQPAMAHTVVQKAPMAAAGTTHTVCSTPAPQVLAFGLLTRMKYRS